MVRKIPIFIYCVRVFFTVCHRWNGMPNVYKMLHTHTFTHSVVGWLAGWLAILLGIHFAVYLRNQSSELKIKQFQVGWSSAQTAQKWRQTDCHKSHVKIFEQFVINHLLWYKQKPIIQWKLPDFQAYSCKCVCMRSVYIGVSIMCRFLFSIEYN